jgi:hypothetical protein
VPTPRRSELGQQRDQQRRTRAKVGDPHGARARPAVFDGGQRRLHNSLGLRSRHQRRRGDPQRKAPEFLRPQDARDWLAPEPPCCERGQCARCAGIEPARAFGGEPGVVEG